MAAHRLQMRPGRRLPLEEVEYRTSRSGGPGGQNVNKLETRVEARWDVLHSAALAQAERARLVAALGPRIHRDGTLRAVSQRHRTQEQNRRAAVERLAAWVAEALRPRRKRRPTSPTAASRTRRLESKRRRSAVKSSRRRPPEDS